MISLKMFKSFIIKDLKCMLNSPVFADRCLQIEVRKFLNLAWFDFQVARLKSLILTILTQLSKYYWFSLNL